MFQRILLPTDGSQAALCAAHSVADLAAPLGQTVHVTIVAAIAPIRAERSDLDERIVALQNQNLRCHAQSVLESTATLFAARGIPHGLRVLEAEPVSEAILREAEAERYDLIAMGSRGMGMSRNDWRHVGSVTERVIRRSPVPVLVLPVHPND